MTTEDQLKNFILARYRSIREFTIDTEIPYTTIDSIFRRGINNSSVSTVIKICKALRISADELAEGKIVTITEHIISDDLTDIRDILSDTKARLIQHNNLTLDGSPVDEKIIDTLIQGIDISVEMVKRQKQNG